ncbi:MAG: aminoacetone oxidase family FAD-binding enzyme [Eubacteriales bacterium]|nr:aminoacetone oxidase family FAD-binding enzyme [Eubacteriales bacterium]
MTTLILGGGAAGMCAAIAAAQAGQRVTVLERGAKPLKKLGVTGNGRCNLLNAGAPVYYGDTAFALDVLERCPFDELFSFFEQLGVPLRREDEGRIYPAALQASVVVEALKLRASQLGVETITGARARAIARTRGGFTVQAELEDASRDFRADRVIVTVGGAAAPAHGTDGSAYGLLTAFGHRLATPRPALCALKTGKSRLSGLSGQRVRAVLTLGERQTSGEVLFGDDAISGIAAMQLARFVQSGDSVSLDLRPALCWTDADEREIARRLAALAQSRRDRELCDWLTGLFTAPVARALLQAAHLWEPRLPLSSLADDAPRRLARTLCAWRFPLTGVRGFEQAQVTAGGISPADFDPATLESRLCPGLYAAGEVLDVDGDCGGFNLMFAFATGLLAGRGRTSPAAG